MVAAFIHWAKGRSPPLGIGFLP